jgi:hypothetical protein
MLFFNEKRGAVDVYFGFLSLGDDFIYFRKQPEKAISAV